MDSPPPNINDSAEPIDGPRRFLRMRSAEVGIELTDADFEQCDRLMNNWDSCFADLETAVREGTISRPAAAYMAVKQWLNKPDHVSVDYRLWASMFRDAGFTESQCRAAAPTKPALLFRGATPERVRGLAWTVDLEQARYFATQRQLDPAAASVWMAWVPPELMLAKYGHPQHRGDWGESEVVVDAEHLTGIVELSDSRVERLMPVHGGLFSQLPRKHLKWALQARRLRKECERAAR